MEKVKVVKVTRNEAAVNQSHQHFIGPAASRAIFYLTPQSSSHPSHFIDLLSYTMATAINIVKVEPTDDGQDAVKIINFETVASYNWLDEPRPTILVPGQSWIDGLGNLLLTDSHYRRCSANLGSSSDQPNIEARHWRPSH